MGLKQLDRKHIPETYKLASRLYGKLQASGVTWHMAKSWRFPRFQLAFWVLTCEVCENLFHLCCCGKSEKGDFRWVTWHLEVYSSPCMWSLRSLLSPQKQSMHSPPPCTLPHEQIRTADHQVSTKVSSEECGDDNRVSGEMRIDEQEEHFHCSSRKNLYVEGFTTMSFQSSMPSKSHGIVAIAALFDYTLFL